MATLGSQALTLADIKKRLDPDGNIAYIIEALLNSNPILDSMVWKEGNLPTGNKTTVRASMPRPSVRRINAGVLPHKSTTRQVQDTCIILEDRSEVDVEEIALAPNKEAFRRSEDAAFVGGFSDAIAANLFYGDADTDPDTFNGLSTRYDTFGGPINTASYQVISAGTANTNGKNTSAYFVGWGTHATSGIYPKHSQAGLQQRDLGEQTVLDKNGGRYQALTTLFTWKAGLAVQDIRSNAIVRNIDVEKLNDLKDDAKKSLIAKFITAKNNIRNLQNRDKKVILYVSPILYNFLEIYLSDKTNVYITRQELMNDIPRLYLSGIEIQRCDAISEEEAAVEKATV
ncbi:hypothetical protein TAMA11512_12920 [Selenomonas sp. TAMA-11512]|uniref:major capsid protein n=1 Tax=Selenomonas sp. TAMA-11512 TaxID=3095337 RepID=UPI003090F7DA|nr:hypothetical protein TAMA11512_12920 [Selenomonas sp. TAMA-11512]